MPDLYPYQADGVAWLTPRRRSFLFDEMGLGKTPQAIRAADARGSRSMLVICPAIARRKWAREIKTWGAEHWRPYVIEGTKAWPSRGTNAVVINYDVLGHYAEQLGDIRWDEAIVDEGHFLKTPGAQRTKEAYGRQGILRRASALTLLTGTPARNNPSELWTHLITFYGASMEREGIPTDPEIFALRYCEVISGEYGPKIVGSRNLDELKAFLAPRMLRRKLDEVGLQLPPLRLEEYPLPFRGHGRLEALLGGEFPEVIARLHEQNAPDDEIDATLLAMSQEQSATYRRVTGLLKADPIADMIVEDFEEGLDKIVIFAWHRQVIEHLAARLAQFGVVVIHGGTSAGQKDEAITRFNEPFGPRVCIGQLEAVGTAIDLVGAAEGVFAERAWVPDQIVQPLKRLHRIGQTRPVRIRFPFLAGTIDEPMTRTVVRKARMLEPLFG